MFFSIATGDSMLLNNLLRAIKIQLAVINYNISKCKFEQIRKIKPGSGPKEKVEIKK